MSPEERELLERSVKLAEDNNKMLHSMHRSMKWSSVLRAVYWIIVLGSAFGLYYLVQPYTDQFMKSFKGVQNDFHSVNNFFQDLKK